MDFAYVTRPNVRGLVNQEGALPLRAQRGQVSRPYVTRPNVRGLIKGLSLFVPSAGR